MRKQRLAFEEWAAICRQIGAGFYRNRLRSLYNKGLTPMQVWETWLDERVRAH